MASRTEEVWAQRVAAWRASGLSSEAFSRGREFTAGGLRHWAYLLRRRGVRRTAITGAKPRAAKPARIRLARVALARSAARGATDATPLAGGPATAAPTRMAAPASSGVALEVGRVRLVLEPGFDRGTLASALAVLEAGGPR